jgi:Gpi18-like mannosyltransferase
VVLLAVGLALRLAALQLPGHGGDNFVISGWAERLAEVGPWGFYAVSGSVYPALLYLYWPLGVFLDGGALETAVKASSIPFDLGIGLLLWLAVRSIGRPVAGLAAAALYLLNPAVLIAGPMWGQIDAAGTLLMLESLMMLSWRRYATAGALAALAGLVKPQFGLVALAVLLVAALEWRARRGPAPLLRVVGGGIIAYGAVTLPLLLSPMRYANELIYIAGYQPFASLFAPNPWGLLIGNGVPDGGWAPVGGVLLLIGLLLALVPLISRRDLATLLAVGALIVFATYFLPTRVHERYLFPATALLAPFAAVSLRSLASYVVLSLAFAGSLLYALGSSAPSTVAPELREVLLTPAAFWIMGVALMLAALAQVWLMLGPDRARLGAN